MPSERSSAVSRDAGSDPDTDVCQKCFSPPWRGIWGKESSLLGRGLLRCSVLLVPGCFPVPGQPRRLRAGMPRAGGKKGQKKMLALRKSRKNEGVHWANSWIHSWRDGRSAGMSQGWPRSPNPPVHGVVSRRGHGPCWRGLRPPQLISCMPQIVPQIVLRAGYSYCQPRPGFCPWPGRTQRCSGWGEASR